MFSPIAFFFTFLIFFIGFHTESRRAPSHPIAEATRASPAPQPWGHTGSPRGPRDPTFLGRQGLRQFRRQFFRQFFFATYFQQKGAQKNWCENWRVAWRHALAQKLAAKLAHFWRHVAGTFGMLSLSFGRSFEFHFLKNYIFLFGPSGAHSN